MMLTQKIKKKKKDHMSFTVSVKIHCLFTLLYPNYSTNCLQDMLLTFDYI